MDVIDVLFRHFPRVVGFRPATREFFKRKKVTTRLEFLKLINRYSGTYEIFTSIYDNDKTIDKIFIDIDSYDTLDRALNIAKRLYEKLTVSMKLPVIPVFSGMKGFHLHILLKPKQYEHASDLLTNATLQLVTEKTDEEGIGQVIECVDQRFIGAINSLCRVPNTERIGLNAYCVSLPQSFLDLSLKEIIKLSKSKQTFEYDFSGYKFCYLTELINDQDIFSDVDRTYNTKEFDKVGFDRINFFPKSGDVKRYLKPLLPPCLFNEIIKPEPSHAIRVATTAFLLMFLEPKQIENIFSRLGWVDYNQRMTHYQVQNISQRAIRPFSCKKLSFLTASKYCNKCNFKR